MTVEIIEGDCRDVLKEFADSSIDAVVTDPPYGLSFMGKHWDYDVPGADIWREVLRTLKPGGHLLSFGGSRTYHRMAVAIEDAGFEIRDQIMWIYASGFPPKSSNQDGDWEGWGTALKPAHEPIVVARKPFIGTMAKNLATHGVGALNIDGCRVSTEDNLNGGAYANGGSRTQLVGDERQGAAAGMFQAGKTVEADYEQPEGRWPANIIHDGSDEVLAAFPNAGGQLRAVGPQHGAKESRGVYGDFGPRDQTEPRVEDDKSAARFFYCAKASRADRDAGLDGFAKSLQPSALARVSQLEGKETTRISNTKNPRANTHPTVKPTDLMRYLCRLVTPPRGVVLDPFMGSGSTGRGAILEGFSFIGIEMDAAYYDIADARIAAAEQRVALKVAAE